MPLRRLQQKICPVDQLEVSHPHTRQSQKQPVKRHTGGGLRWRTRPAPPQLDKLPFRRLLGCETRSPVVCALQERFFWEMAFLINIWWFKQGTRENTPHPPLRHLSLYPTLALPGWNNLSFLLVKMLIHGSARKAYLYHNATI